MVLERFLRNNCGHWPCSIQKSLGLSRPAGGCTLTTSLLEGASIAAANRGILHTGLQFCLKCIIVIVHDRSLDQRIAEKNKLGV